MRHITITTPIPIRSYYPRMSKHEEPKVVAEYVSEFEANIVCNMLREEGIPCQIMGGTLAGFRAEAPNLVRLLVPAEFEERALRVLIEHDATRASDEPDADEG